MVGRETLFEDVYQRSGGDPLGANYDVFPNGKEFLMIRGEPAGKRKLLVVVNWFEELQRQMRAVIGNGSMSAPALDAAMLTTVRQHPKLYWNRRTIRARG